MSVFGTYKTGKFNQIFCERHALNEDIISLAAINDGTVFAASQTGVFALSGGEWTAVLKLKGLKKLFRDKNSDTVYAAVEKSVYILSDKKADKIFDFPDTVTALGGSSAVYALTEKALYVLGENGFGYVQETESPCFCLSEENGRISIGSERSIHRLEGKRKTWRCIFPEHSTMPELHINCIAFDTLGTLWVGADEGMYLYDYKQDWYSYKQITALPREKVYDIEFTDGGVLCGTAAGAVIIKDGAPKYLPAERYAFSSDVKSVAVSGGCVYTASKGGVIKISEKPMTLKEKADYFFEVTEKYFPRKDGYVTSITGIKNGDIASAAPSRITDNDGLWTESYLAALCLCYNQTKDEAVLKAARRSKDAMLFLMRAPEIPGFTARAVRYPDEKNWGKGLKTQEIGSEWHRSSDGTYEWLGETSSDEMTGHYMGLSLYYDMCASGQEKKEISSAVCAITDHILEHDGYLFDFDNKPTTWACWNHEALNHDSMWMWEKGINSLQFLSFLKVSFHLSGEKRYDELYKKYIRDYHYLINSAYHKREDGHSCHIDDNLGMCISLTLLRLEDDAAIRNFLLMGLTSHWEYERIEGNPFYNFVYAGFTGRPCNVDGSVKVLCDYPLDLINYNMVNSRRIGLVMDDEPVKWGGGPRLSVPFNWDEKMLSRFGTNPFAVDGGRPDCAESGMTYLLMYWLGVWFGLIE